jgi:hypothetical protein
MDGHLYTLVRDTTLDCLDRVGFSHTFVAARSGQIVGDLGWLPHS